MLSDKFNDRDRLMTIGLLARASWLRLAEWLLLGLCFAPAWSLGRRWVLAVCAHGGVPQIAYPASTHPLGGLGIGMGLHAFMLLFL